MNKPSRFVTLHPQDLAVTTDPYADERLEHAIRFASQNGQNIVIEGDGSIRLEPAEPALPPFRPNYKGWVYVIRVRGFDLIKIGYSTDPERRLLELASGSGMGEGLEKLFHFPGDGYMERGLHRRFAQHRLFGEWFRLEGELAAWVAAETEGAQQ